jgi:molybdate transport repressor ModE-like protein
MKFHHQALLLGRLLQAKAHEGSIRKAAKAVNIPYSTAWRWLWKLNQPLAPKGIRKGALTALQRGAAFDKLSHASASEVAVQLFNEGIVERLLHKTTVIRAAKAHADEVGIPLKYSQGKPQKELSQATLKARLAFAKENAKTNWNLVLFTDRKKFGFKYPGVKVYKGKWLKGKEKHIAHQVNHAYTVNVYCGLSPHGMTVAHAVAGTKGLKSPYCNKQGKPAKNITAEEYEQVMKTTLLPGGRSLFTQGNGIGSWVFQQDNDPAHKDASKHLRAWNNKHKSSVRLLANWPPNSPDLSPIENVWAWMEAKLNALGCATFSQYKEAVMKISQQVPKSMLANLYKSMPRRLELVLANGGGKTGY